MTPEEILPRFHHVRPSGKGWTARCSAHEDHDNSLSIDPKDDGGTLLHCFKGCSSEAITAAVGLKPADLYPPRQQPSRMTPPRPTVTVEDVAAAKGLPSKLLSELGWTNERGTIRIPYRTEEGQVLARAHIRRSLEKVTGFPKFIWDGPGDVPLIAYGLWRIAEARRAKRLVLCEGETDTITCWHVGLPALGIPGATTVQTTLKPEMLAGLEHVVITKDSDAGGDAFIATTHEAARAAGVGKITVVPMPAGAKDVNEWYRRCSSREKFLEEFRHAVETAPTGDPPPSSLTTTQPTPHVEWPASWRLLDDVQIQELPDPEWIVNGIIQKSSVATIYALPNTAKTTLIAGLCVSVATGRPWFGHATDTQGGCIYVPSEDMSGWKIRLEAAKQLARIDPSHSIGVFTFEPGMNLLDPVMVDQFIAFWGAAQAQGAAFSLVVFDTLSGMMPGANENAIEAMGVALDRAGQIGKALGATVLLSHHTNASGTRERGHGSLRGDSDTMIALETVDDVIRVECNKQRNGPVFKSFDLRIVPLGKSVVVRAAQDVFVPAEKLSEHQWRALIALRDTFSSEGATSGQWLRVSTSTGMSEATFYRASKHLESLRYVSKVGQTFRISTDGLKALEAIGR